MSICTVFLYHDSTTPGWHVEIDGLIYSQRTAFQKKFPQSKLSHSDNTVVISGEEETEFKGHQSKPPLHIVISYLKQIAAFGYKVESSDSTSDENGFRKTTLWTLQCIN